MDAIRTFLDVELGLSLREDAVRLRPCTATEDYLGYRVSRDGHVLGDAAFERLERRLVRIVRRRRLRPVDLQRLERGLISFRGMLEF